INAQGVQAQFLNQDNDLSHLEKGIESGTISKLILRSSSVKSITQPYNSFDGKQEENDQLYYKRVSERLRHKNRAVNVWDYEHLILQEFPDIYRVKCLCHTDVDSFVAPGNVTLVVVPDTVNKNVFDIYQPRVSKAKLNKIQNFVSALSSLHVNTEVANPNYQKVEVEVTVKFYKGSDDALYKIELETDIKKLLSPWAFDEAKSVEFGVVLHRSVLIDYIEKLNYVDYVRDIVIKLGNAEEIVKNATPSSPRSILVSAESHLVTIDEDLCDTSPSELIEEKCQV
ncbi:MAG: baseplate J/gp47 family protein, partial [Flavobacteriales bacterium]|nr:baseplate J/gp47 family protein [Flavobacteriales bacterium]